MKKSIVMFALVLTAIQSYGTDLFQDGKLRDIKKGDLIVATDTIGGYPIYQDDGRWQFVGSKQWQSTVGDTIKMGEISLNYYQGSELLARQWLQATLAPGTISNWNGTPCSPDHLIVRNKGRGKQDNCMTIDPRIINVGATPTLFLTIALTNTGSNGRYYRLNLFINADQLGIKNTGLADWTKEDLKVDAKKQEVLDRLTKWAELLQDASIQAFDFSKPQDVYAKIPLLASLLPAQ